MSCMKYLKDKVIFAGWASIAEVCYVEDVMFIKYAVDLVKSVGKGDVRLCFQFNNNFLLRL